MVWMKDTSSVCSRRLCWCNCLSRHVWSSVCVWKDLRSWCEGSNEETWELAFIQLLCLNTMQKHTHSTTHPRTWLEGGPFALSGEVLQRLLWTQNLTPLPLLPLFHQGSNSAGSEPEPSFKPVLCLSTPKAPAPNQQKRFQKTLLG